MAAGSFRLIAGDCEYFVRTIDDGRLMGDPGPGRRHALHCRRAYSLAVYVLDEPCRFAQEEAASQLGLIQASSVDAGSLGMTGCLYSGEHH